MATSIPLNAIALVNPKSGGNMGAQLLQKFSEVLGSDRVFDIIADKGPKKALEAYKGKKNLRVIACGGDGTVGWVLTTIDEVFSAASEKDSRPPVAIVPLGTGNDLARALNWGGKYEDKPVNKILSDVAKADDLNFDRWNLRVVQASKGGLDLDGLNGPYGADDEIAVEKLPLNVCNNYFTMGIDAQISLDFHHAREANPEAFTSRTRNLMFYGKKGSKDLFKRKWKNLMDYVSVECDGVDYTERLKKYGAHSVMFLNIRSYAGGCKPWKDGKKGKSTVTDGLIELVAVDNYDLAVLQAGGSGAGVCQCRKAVVKTTTCIPMQVDGEPCLMAPCTIEIEAKPVQSKMLVRNKKAIYTEHDADVEDWAAIKIQESYKDSRRRKKMQKKNKSNVSLASLGKPTRSSASLASLEK